MTCICVLKNKRGKLVFGSERRVINSHKYVLPIPKIVKRNGIIIGGAGGSFVCSLITTSLPIPAYNSAKSTQEYMFDSFLPSSLEFLREHKIIHPTENRVNIDPDLLGSDSEAPDASVFLLGIKGSLYEFEIDSKYFYLDVVPTPYAIGCGGKFALGSLLTTSDMPISVNEKLKLALKATSHLDPNCDDNIDIMVED